RYAAYLVNTYITVVLIIIKMQKGGFMKNLLCTYFMLPYLSLTSLAIGQQSESYKSTNIGSQIWMTENLNKEYYNNGIKIPEAKSWDEWISLFEKKTGCYYVYNGIYGKTFYYNWWAIYDPQGLAPAGWHIADENEWWQLCYVLGGKSKAGKKMKSRNWDKGKGTNESGFSAYPTGYYRGKDGKIINKKEVAYWWSKSMSMNDSSAINSLYDQESKVEKSKSKQIQQSIKIFYVYNLTAMFYLYEINSAAEWFIHSHIVGKYDKASGFSVRCIKDVK
ncbi:MAG: fibrobacter succinogenes major paralogous domain-containing protein, partial [Bacteroidota bacterium]